MNNSTDQVTNFVDETAHVPAPNDTTAEGQDKPLIPFPTSYVLTGQQEADLIEHALNRLTQLEEELGRTSTGGLDWYKTQGDDTAQRSFLGKRQLFEMMYHNEVDWRPFCLGGIFEKSNLVVPLSRRIVRQMVARANNYFFSTDPWFAAYPVGVSDQDLAQDIERYTRFKFDVNKQKHVLELAVELAFVRGETVIKTTHETREQLYQQTANVLVDAQGKDILDADGDYIVDTDVWIEQTESAVDPSTGLPGPALPTGKEVLKRDSETLKPAVLTYVNKMITRRITQFSGAESAIVFYKDFLCPLNAADVQAADTIVQLYDMPVMNLADMYQRKAMLNMSTKEAYDQTKKAIDLIRSMSSASGAPKAAKGQPRPELGEGDNPGSAEDKEPVVEIAEFHMRYDANGDGIMEDIMLVVDRANKVPIFYDYEANITPDGLRPFDVIKINQVDGRWHGIGGMEMFQSSQEIVDLLVNRWNFSQSSAGRVDLWSPHNTQEGDSNKHLKLNWGKTYTPKPGMKAADILETVTLPDIKHEALQAMFEFFMQMSTNESGVANANDAQMVGLDTSELATGVRNIEKSGEEMFALYLSHLEPGIQSTVQRNFKVTFANLDQREIFTFFEGDERKIGVIQQEDVKDLDLDVSLLLTRYRGQQVLQSSMQGAALTTQFYAFAPDVQMRVAPLYRDMLKALQVSNADEIISPLPPLPPGMPGQPVSTGPLPKVSPPMALAAATPPPGQSPNNL